MTKTELRKKYKLLRKQLTNDGIDELSMTIANRLLNLNIWEFNFYHIFLSIETQKEINTDHILSILSGYDKNIVISKSNFETLELTNYLLTDSTTIHLNDYDIPEPIDGIEIDDGKIDVVFVPLLAFDVNGNRVGYGKGFYDGFLSKCKPETIKIGLSLFEAEAEIKDVFENDVSLDYCVTPNETYIFQNSTID